MGPSIIPRRAYSTHNKDAIKMLEHMTGELEKSLKPILDENIKDYANNPDTI